MACLRGGSRFSSGLGLGDALEQLPQEEAAHDDARDGEARRDGGAESVVDCRADFAKGGGEVREVDNAHDVDEVHNYPFFGLFYSAHVLCPNNL